MAPALPPVVEVYTPGRGPVLTLLLPALACRVREMIQKRKLVILRHVVQAENVLQVSIEN